MLFDVYICLVLLQASEREIIWVMRVAIIGVGILATVMGITITSIYGLWFLCADLVYVILFPQLVCVVYLKGTNTYGSLAGYLIGLLFRLLGGEPLVGLPAAIAYPGYIADGNEQRFPFRTLAMVLSFTTILVVSYPVRLVFERHLLPKHWDVFQCIVNIPEEVIALKEPNERGEMAVIHAKKGIEDPSSGTGEINPALKFSKADLLDVSPAADPGETSSLACTPTPDPWLCDYVVSLDLKSGGWGCMWCK